MKITNQYFAIAFTLSAMALIAAQTPAVHDKTPVALTLSGDSRITIQGNASASYRILVVARGEGGAQQAALEASGLAHRSGGELRLLGDKVTTIYRGDPGIGFRVLADTKPGAIRLEAQGLERKTIRWVARVELTEVRF